MFLWLLLWQDTELAISATVNAVGQQIVGRQLRQYFITDLYATRYWDGRRQALRQRRQAAARLREKMQEAQAGAGQRHTDSGSPTTTAKLALQQAECAVEMAVNGSGSLHDALQQGENLLSNSVIGQGNEAEAVRPV